MQVRGRAPGAAGGGGRGAVPPRAMPSGETTGSQAWPGSVRPVELLTWHLLGLPGEPWLGLPLCSALLLLVSFISFLVSCFQ